MVKPEIGKWRLKNARRFTSSVTSFGLLGGAIVHVLQVDSAKGNVLIDFGSGVIAWFGEAVLEYFENVTPDDVPADSDEDRTEAAFERGNRAAWVEMLGVCISKLGYSDADANRVAWIKEREEAVAMLRRVCEEHGDNEWPDDLHLADVVEKHLSVHLDKGAE